MTVDQRPGYSPVLRTALAAWDAGICVVPPNGPGHEEPKSPLFERVGGRLTWKHFQSERPDRAKVERWYAEARTWVGAVCGAVSGGLELFEFDDMGTYRAFVEAAGACGLGDLVAAIEAGYCEDTPGGGVHWFYYCDEVGGNTKLARRDTGRPVLDPETGEPVLHKGTGRPLTEVEVLIETRGEGGFAVIAPTTGLHPNGRGYTLRSGGVASIATITGTQRESLWDLARTFDEMPGPANAEPEPSGSKAEGRAAGEVLPGEDYNSRATWDEVLSGWTRLHTTSAGVTYWRRPGKSHGWSATTNHKGNDRLNVYSSSTELGSVLDDRKTYDKFGAYAALNHRGDLKAAARDLADSGFGTYWDGLTRQYRRNPRPAGKPNFVNCGGSVNGSQVQSPKESPPWRPPRLKQDFEAVPFPIDVLPLRLAELCRVGARAVQCPVDFFGAASLALAGGVLGLSVNLTVKAHYTESSNLYLAIVGPPGTKKTPALKILARPLYAIDREMRDEYRLCLARYEELKREWDTRRRGGEGGPPPTRPIQEQLTLDDTTREAVAQVHSENPRGLVLIKDELTSWVSALDAYRSGKGDDKQFWLKINSGVLVKVNRKTSEREPILIPQPCVTIVGGLTPDTLPSIKGGLDDGWIDRILFAYPEPLASIDWSEEEIPDELISDWSEAVGRLWSRKMVLDAGRLRPCFVRMTEPAKALWREWINAHRKEAKDPDFPRSLSGPWSKIEGFVARLALILSQLHQAYDPTDCGPPKDVTPLDVWGARRLGDYFKAHFRRARSDLMRRADMPDDCEAITKWVRATGRETFSERDARRNFPRRFGGNLLALADALEWLVRRDCIRVGPAPEHKVGRTPSQIYEVNPLLFGHPEVESEDEEGLSNSLGDDTIDAIDKTPEC